MAEGAVVQDLKEAWKARPGRCVGVPVPCQRSVKGIGTTVAGYESYTAIVISRPLPGSRRH